jgi:peptide/nickel transport system permease protein
MSSVAEPIAAKTPSESQIARRETLRQLVRSPTFIVGSMIVAFWIVCAIFGESIAPKDPLANTPDVLFAPGGGYWFGTDQLGRDVFARVLAGARDIMIVAPAATALGIVGGTVVGLITGYFRGVIDDTVSRVIDAVLALPVVIIAVTAITALGQSTATLVIVVGVVFTPLVARTVRAAVLAERDLDYVPAARLRGERAPYIMFAEILPNITGPIIVEATVRLGYAIFAVAGITFLGFGVQPPSPDWALQINDNYTLLNAGTYWWTVLFPGFAVASLVVGVNLIADGLTQVFDRR